jgi:gas vesicle structural protein
MVERAVSPEDELSLVELVNRVLDKGAVVSGDVVISVAGVDLIYVGLRVLLSSVESMRERSNPDSPSTSDTRRLR